MNEDRIKQLIEAFGYTGKDADTALRLCREVERETRQSYFRLVQVANNAASSLSIDAREFDTFVWNSEQEKRLKAAKQ